MNLPSSTITVIDRCHPSYRSFKDFTEPQAEYSTDYSHFMKNMDSVDFVDLGNAETHEDTLTVIGESQDDECTSQISLESDKIYFNTIDNAANEGEFQKQPS